MLRAVRMQSLTAAAVAVLLLANPLTAYAASGDPDSSFDGDGWLTLALGTGSATARAVRVVDNKIVVAGDFETATDRDLFVARFESDGDPDPTFGGGDGVWTHDFGDSDFIGNEIAVRSDGKLVLTGYTSESSIVFSLLLIRLTTGGALDSSFGVGDGFYANDFGFDEGVAAYSLLQLKNDKLIVVGGVYPGGSECDFGFWRFNAGGSLDLQFGGGDGMTVVNIAPGCDEAWQLVRQNDGQLVAGGWAHNDGPASDDDVALARVLANGAVDSSFGQGGKVTYNPTIDDNEWVQEILKVGQKLLLLVPGGRDTEDVVIMRLTPSGLLDGTFDGDGKVRVDFGGDEDVEDMAIDSNGRIVVTGRIADSLFVARLLAGGAPDNSFGGDGLVEFAPMGPGRAIALQSNGRIVVAGLAGDDAAVARFLP